MGFEAPGPGSWFLDTTHFDGPVSRFVREVFAEPAARGFGDGTRPYGLLLDRIEWAFTGGWPYLRPRRIGPLETSGELTRAEWERLVASSPALQDRLETSSAVFERRRWRDDLELWDREVKPASVRANVDIAAVTLEPMGLHDLIRHVERCRANLRRALYRHHRFNVASVIAVGDFLVHGEEWTGGPLSALLGALRSSTPVFLGGADIDEPGLEDVPVLALSMLDEEPERLPWSGGHEPERLPWSGGHEPERPVGAGGTGRLRSGRSRGERAAEETAAVLRDAVPAPVRPMFDEQLAEARATYRLRDERATFCDVWALGLARRAVLALGAKLEESGLVSQPLDLLEAGYAEMRSLAGGADAPSAGDLAARARQRAQASFSDAPPHFGPPPRSPVPVEWLPVGAARTERAFRSYMAAMEGDDPPASEAGAGARAARRSGTKGARAARRSGRKGARAARRSGRKGARAARRSGSRTPRAGDQFGRLRVRGVGASPGRYEGRACVVNGAGELGRLADGDVLVAASTGAAFNAVLPLLGAIVTDQGGLLSHAAIVAREFGIPAVVGAGDATRLIASGATVVVDGDTGEVSAPG